ncbi:MAG: flippase-like domain-containing protein [bacterium]|nr:flippase-like domain-containing protein [bacterium]
MAQEPLESAQQAQVEPDAEVVRRDTPGSAKLRAKKIAPWIVAIAIFAWLFSEVPIEDAWAATRQARLELFLPIMAVAVVLWFSIDSAVFAYLFTRFNAVLPWAEARSLRGLTYLLTPINWNLGTAAVILHLRTSKGIGALESASSMLLYQTVDAMVLAGYALIGTLLLPLTPEIASLRSGALVFVLVPVVSLSIFMGTWPTFRWLARVREAGLFRSHQAAGARDIAVIAGCKAIYFSVFVAMFALGGAAFGIELPLAFAVASTPVILLAGSLPITPAGLGTQQAAMLYFYGPYGDKASILAFGLAFPIVLHVFRLLLGLVYLRDLPKLREALAEQPGA